MKSVKSILAFSECAFENNHNPVLVNEGEEGVLVFDSCVFTGNAWD